MSRIGYLISMSRPISLSAFSSRLHYSKRNARVRSVELEGGICRKKDRRDETLSWSRLNIPGLRTVSRSKVQQCRIR